MSSSAIARTELAKARYALTPRTVPAEYIYAPDNHPPDDPVALYRWAREGAPFVPRSRYVERMGSRAVPVVIDRRELQGIRDYLAERAPQWERRCAMEAAVADYILDIGQRTGRGDLVEVARTMYDCHQRGPLMRVDVGDVVVGWQAKCGMVRVCPHESYDDQKRVAEHYAPGIRELVDAGPHRRVFYAVHQPDNYPAGSLADGKREAAARCRDWLKSIPNLVGALVCQEDPLSHRRDWNVHSNVLMVLEGDVDYAELRERAGCRVHLDQVRDVQGRGLLNAIAELIKYSAKLTHVVDDETEATDLFGELAEQRRQAPALTQWSPAEFVEWWDAQKGFRRVRSYGALYAIDGKRWDAADAPQRAQWLDEAATHDLTVTPDLAQLCWREQTKRHREAIKAAMLSGERIDLSRAFGIGSVEFDAAAGELLVTLQPGDKSGAPPLERTSREPARARLSTATGPPS